MTDDITKEITSPGTALAGDPSAPGLVTPQESPPEVLPGVEADRPENHHRLSETIRSAMDKCGAKL